MQDPVREYLERQGYAGYIVEGGLDYLLSSWEDIVVAVKKGEPLDSNEYLRGMDRRRILQETLDLIPLYQQAWYHQRVHEADQQIRVYLVASEIPLCGPAVADAQGYTPERHWWYYHLPRHLVLSWPETV